MLLKMKKKPFRGTKVKDFYRPSDKETCSRKIRHLTADNAYQLRDRKFPHLNVYFCNVCQGWHLGHRYGQVELEEDKIIPLEDYPMMSNGLFQKYFKITNIRKRRSRDYLRKKRETEFKRSVDFS